MANIKPMDTTSCSLWCPIKLFLIMITKIKNIYLVRHLLTAYNGHKVKPLRYCKVVPIKVVLDDVLKDISLITDLPKQKNKINHK